MAKTTLTRANEIASKLLTGNQARNALGKALVQLSGAYENVKNYNAPLLGVYRMPTTGVTLFSSEDKVTSSAIETLDGIRTRAEADFSLIPATNQPFDMKLTKQIGFDIASIEKATGMTAELGTAVQDLKDTVKETAADIGKGAVNLLETIKKYIIYIAIGLGVLMTLFIVAKGRK